ncbi:MAG: 4-alpha-glucanotransferase [Calditrichaeota bacterium]|nr:MAG: 4-alpha-glucanotransferase [Calditrichota bacterium]
MKAFERSSGLLLHPTSLPGRYGIGELGKMAYQWVDFLKKASQSIWQILPLGPTGYGNSPYQTVSVFAGNPLMIDLTLLVEWGYLPDHYLENIPRFPEGKVDYDTVIAWKIPLLLETYERYQDKANPEEKKAFEAFCEKHNSEWLDDFSLFLALKNHFGGKSWHTWDASIKHREPKALEHWKEKLSESVQAQKFLQYLFFKQWEALKKYANEQGVFIFGDIPIYVTYDSADVWAHQELFSLDEQGLPTHVAGVPPDYFSKTGQLWGNPLYNWDAMRENDYQWWKQRIRLMLEMVDLFRIDHFRGFEGYWAVPFGNKTAEHGEWMKGPGAEFFQSLLETFGRLPVVVEDLGIITPEVEALRDQFGFPGMKILQFAFDSGPKNPFLPHNFDKNCVVYTGSHDNDTTVGWFAKARPNEREYCLKYLGGKKEDIAWQFIRLALSSTAMLSIFPVQDILSLGSEARMNLPGEANGNWTWRLKENQLRDEHASRLAELCEIYGRAR